MDRVKWTLAILTTAAIFSYLRAFDGPDLVGEVTHVRDGDTFLVRGVPVRLLGLTCDERDTKRGVSATRAVTRLTSGQTISCSLTGDMSYDREVGRCQLADGRDIAAELISAGECGRCAKYDPAGYYIAPQKQAGRYRGFMPKYCRT